MEMLNEQALLSSIPLKVSCLLLPLLIRAVLRKQSDISHLHFSINLRGGHILNLSLKFEIA